MTGGTKKLMTLRFGDTIGCTTVHANLAFVFYRFFTLSAYTNSEIAQ